MFEPDSSTPFRLSRSKIDLFIDCPRCFYLDRRFGIARPQFPAFTLNSAVDYLLKKEFDIHRAKGEPHPLMKKYKVDAVPFSHEKLGEWRENFKGVSALHKPTNLTVFGAVDDIWRNSRGELHVVDYKSTSKDEAPNLDGRWQQAFKRQMEVYQWLLRQSGFAVSNTGYFVYVNGKRDREAFDGKLEFDAHLISYVGADGWIEPTLKRIKACLISSRMPEPQRECEYCGYRKEAASAAAKFERIGKESAHEDNEKKRKQDAPAETGSLF